MANKTYKLGELLELSDERNSDNKYNLDNIKGISTEKKFIETKANMDGVSLSSYKVVNKDEFAYVADTSRRGDKIALAYNNEQPVLISSIYTVFKVSRPDLLNSDYLYMYFNRPEFDRYSRFNSWGSAREVFSWEDFCDIDITLPELKTQEKYVEIYESLVENQKSYERGLDDLKLTCDATIEDIRRNNKPKSFFPYISERCEINKDVKFKNLVGVGGEGFIEPRGSRDEETFYKCNIFYPKDFVYNPSVIAKGAIAFNLFYTEPRICTEEYIVFYVNDESILNPEYLFMWLRKEETGRYFEFMNIDSVRNRVYFRDLEQVKIPIPDIEIQNSIANIHNAYEERKRINEKLKSQIKEICPILIKGSLEEAKEA